VTTQSCTLGAVISSVVIHLYACAYYHHYYYYFYCYYLHLAEVYSQLFNLSSPHVHYSYAYDFERLDLNTLHNRKYNNPAMPHFQVYFDSKFCPFILETVVLRVPAPYVRDFSMSVLQAKIVLLDAFWLLML
jgi:hypothetical protein